MFLFFHCTSSHLGLRQKKNILPSVDPFRKCPPRFTQKCVFPTPIKLPRQIHIEVKQIHGILGQNIVHLIKNGKHFFDILKRVLLETEFDREREGERKGGREEGWREKESLIHV